MHQITYDTNEALISGFQQGEQEAFTQLYHRFNTGLYYFARRFISHDDANDAIADAFVRLWHDRANFDAVPKIERWLFVTIRNDCYAVLRRQVRQQGVKAELLHQLETAEVSTLLSEEITTALVALLYKEIDRLPARQKEIFLLSFEEGLKPSAIAERLSLSVKTVKNQKSSAIQYLQAVLGQRIVILSLLVLLHEEMGCKISA